VEGELDSSFKKQSISLVKEVDELTAEAVMDHVRSRFDIRIAISSAFAPIGCNRAQHLQADTTSTPKYFPVYIEFLKHCS
jgi:hypothetical protein